ncbi:MAG: hypothetical protein A2Y07_00220 [Planctomycetes bacterium GWF2_50_10]|nr:MAG: hypothetical protein A2Y07_00220 [Planctomycetes bacterium GWF2_50_10]
MSQYRRCFISSGTGCRWANHEKLTNDYETFLPHLKKTVYKSEMLSYDKLKCGIDVLHSEITLVTRFADFCSLNSWAVSRINL